MPRGTLLARVALALAIGVAGAAMFVWARMPLPWIIGPMAANTVAAMLRLPVAGPMRIRPYVVMVIGVMLGAGFTPALIGELPRWGLSVAGLALYLAAAGALAVPFYRRIGGYDLVTAYFAAMPGGLNEMMLIGREMGGDDRAIALAHASRVVLVVGLAALWFRVVLGLEMVAGGTPGGPVRELPLREGLLLAGAGVAGFVIGPWLRLPAPALIGPMLVSAALHLAGLSTATPPREAIILAQIVIGTTIGCRFVGVPRRQILRALLLGLGAAAMMMALTGVFAAALWALTGLPPSQVVLAYAPGGLAEMSLVALALGAEVAFVATHHVLRITLTILAAPLIFRLLGSRRSG